MSVPLGLLGLVQVAIPGILAAFTVIMLSLAAMQLANLVAEWCRPLIRGIVSLFPGGKLLKSAASWYQHLPKFAKIALIGITPVVGVPIAVAKGALLLERYIQSHLTHFALAKIRPLAAWFASIGLLIEETAHELGDFAHEVETAFGVLRHETIPRLIEDAAAEILLTVGGVTRTLERWADVVDGRLDRLAARVLAVEQAVAGFSVTGVIAYVDAEIGKLHRLLLTELGAVAAGIYTGIDVLRRDLTAELGNLRDYLDDKLRALEPLLNPVALAAAAVAAVITFAPELFCRNTRKGAKALCDMDEGFLDDLLAVGLTALIAVDVLAIVRAAQATASATLPEINRLVG